MNVPIVLRAMRRPRSAHRQLGLAFPKQGELARPIQELGLTLHSIRTMSRRMKRLAVRDSGKAITRTDWCSGVRAQSQGNHQRLSDPWRHIFPPILHIL
ncbi:MAG: hypothetical protein KC592_00605 [Nitrospira sp.]|nr:hypothetical protein [Nitrospira sp.]